MLDFLYTAVSWVLLRWHQLLVAIGMDPRHGITWALSVVLLVVTARLLLFRLFVKQVHYQRNMQRLQPQIKKLREKYKDDRAELNRQMMKFQQEEGFNPLAGCLPLLLQFPVFIGLYHVLRHVANSQALCKTANKPGAHLSHKASELLSSYTFSGGPRGETCSAAQATLFKAPLAASFRDKSHVIVGLGGDPSSTRIVLLILLIVSAVATLTTQIMVRANQTQVLEGTQATIQRAMLWLIPGGVLVSGLLFNFPLGVLLYWFTNNLWTLAQQGYIIRFHPPEVPAVKVVGEVGKTLAPRPGQRPVRDPRAKPGPPTSLDKGAGAAKSGAGRKAAGRDVEPQDVEPQDVGRANPKASGAARGAPPRPGQKPNRASGKRPPAKRPTQAKKRR